MKFDIDSARKAGYSDDEIADYLATENKFDLSGAIESGYSSSDVIDFLSKPQGGKQDLPQDIAPSEGRSATPMGQADPRLVKTDEPKQPAPYKNRTEALDDAVNLLEEGADLGKVNEAFLKIGIKPEEIVSHGKTRGSEFFKQQPAQPLTPEQQQRAANYQPSGEIKAWEPSALDEVGNTIKRGVQRAKMETDTLKFQAGVIDSATYAERVREGERRLGAAAPSGDVVAGLERLGKANESGNYLDVAKELIKPENWKATAALVAESAIPSMANLPYTVAGGLAAGPVGAATAAGATSFASEYANALSETLDKRGVDKSDALALRNAIEDPEVMAEARDRGVKRGIPVAAFDALSAGFAGRFLRTVERAAAEAGKAATKTAVLGATAKEGALQIGTGMGGEFAGQKITGENKPLDVLVEGLAELPGGVAEVMTNLASAQRSPATAPTPQVINFTEPDSATAQAGLTPIVVPVPTAPAPTEVEAVTLPEINQSTEQEFGLDALRMGATNVSTSGVARAAPAAGGIAGSDQLGRGVDLSGSGVAGAEELGAGSAGIPAANAGADVAAGGAAAQPTAGVTPPAYNNAVAQPKEQWFGRKGDGYVTEGDAQQALPGRKRMFPDLDWSVEKMPSGKFRLVGYEKADAAQAVVGDKINKDWTAFSPESDSLGIPRADMPQVKGEHRGAMINFLNARGITNEQDSVDPSTLKPTQAEFSPAKVETAKESRGTDRAILVSSDGRVIDGHHQWMAKLEKGEQVSVIRLDAPAQDLIAAIKEFPSSTTANGATLGTQTTQAIQAEAQGQEARAATAGALSATAEAGATSQLQGAGNPQLTLAKTAPIKTISAVQNVLRTKDNIEVEPLTVDQMNNQQKLASVVANMLGKTFTVVRYAGGNRDAMPNGMINDLGGKHIFAAEDTVEAPLFVAIHEAYHGLPEAERKALNTQLLQLFRAERKGEFLQQFNYTEADFDEEAPAFMAQVISKREDFWNELRTKMGNKEFASVAKIIIDKLTQIVKGVSKEYGEDFANKYITDIVKARGLLTDAYAKAMQEQGLQPDVETVNLQASKRAGEDIGAKLQERIDTDFEGASQEYAGLKGTKGGRLLDTDIARELSPEYRGNRNRSAEVHEAASAFIQRTFESRMAQPGTGDIVAFMAGGGGAGKSSAEALLAPVLDRASTVLDGTLSSYDKARRNVQLALDSGRQVRIAYVYREPVEALRNGVLTRAMRGGRTVPVDALVKGHAGSSTVVRKLQEEFGDNPKFKIFAIDNSRGPGNADIVPLESITSVKIDGLKERFINATEEEYRSGRISEAVYRATVGSQADTGAGAESEAGGREVRQGSAGPVQGRSGSERERDAVTAPRRGAQRVGDFEVRTMKDGTIVVYGDPDSIRAQIPDDVKGRVTKDGIMFTTSAAPRVKAALEGRKTAYSRGGAVLEKLPVKDGKYVGAPEKFNTPGKIPTLRKWLRQLADEGGPGRYWYENSGREVLKMVGGDVQEARKFVALLAIYSPQAKVDANSTFALRAWAQYKAGQPIAVKTGVMDKKAQGALDDVDAFWSGEKTGNFFFNLLREIDPSTAGKQGATIDMWMMRAGQYDTDAPTATQYAFMENETNRLAAELGWEPQQVQAAIWVAMKARMENTGVKKRTEATSEKKGWIRYDYPLKNGRPVKTRVILNDKAHRDNWLKHSFEHDPTKDDTQQAKFDFGDGLKRHIGQISFEARPGRSTGALPGIHSAPYAQQVEFQQAVQKAFYDEQGNDLLAMKLGLLVDTSDILLPGVWQGEVSPSSQKLVAMAPAKGDEGKTNVDPAQAEALNIYAAIAGLVAKQEGVGWHRPFYSATKRDSNGIEIDIGRPINPREAADLEKAIGDWMQDNGHDGWQDQFALISSPNGIRLVNFGIITNEKLHSDILRVAETVLPDAEARWFASSGDMMTNNWKEKPDGQDYVERASASGRSDVLEWARDFLAPRVQRVFTEFSDKYGWGDPGTVRFSNRAGSAELARGPGARADEGTGRTVTGIHYGKAAGLSRLSGAAFGSGIKGAEQARLNEPGVDPRIKKRVYFYLTNNNADMPRPEIGLGAHVYRATLGNMFDMATASAADKQRVMSLRKTPDANGFESAILDAGFRGYVNREMQTAVVLNSDVPVAYEGLANAGKMRDRVAERVVQGTVTRESGDELVRKPSNDEMVGIIKARPALAEAAPSFKLQFGEARVAKAEADAADQVLADAGSSFQFGDVRRSNRSTETAAFKRWFGDSKVVNENGEPLVVYHGSKAKGITVFDTTRVTTRTAKGDTPGTYFTGDRMAAANYTREFGAPIRAPRGDVTAAYLRIENPLNTTAAIKEYRDQGMPFGEAKRKALEALTPENDGIIFDGDGLNPSEYVVFKPEQIKSVDNEGTFDAANPDIRKSNRARDSWFLGRDELGRIKLGAGAKAYRAVADVASNVLDKVGMKPISTELGRAMRQMKVEIAKAREITAGVATKLSELSEQERAMISDVIEKELKRGVKPPKRVLEVAASMKDIMSEQTAELVRLGMLSADAAGRWDGKYLPRFYESKLKDEGKAWAKAAKALFGKPKTMQGIGGSSLKGRGLFQTIPVEELEQWLAEGWEERDPSFDPEVDTEITVWRDYTREERENMGEIRDAMFRFIMGYNKSQRDISLGRLYENLANTVASKSEKEGYVQVPSTNVEDTRARRYGKLAGKWVPREVMDHLSGFDEFQNNDLMRMYVKAMSMWKEGKTVLNPVSHANNVLSNVTMAHFAGVSYWDVNKYVGAVRDIVKNAPMLQEAKDAGLWLGTMTQAELVEMLPDQLKDLAAKQESKSGKVVDSVWNAMSFWLRKPLGKAYEVEDLYFRYLIYRDARQRGVEPADAVDYAQKYIFTYDDLPKTARRVRDFALPFFAYTYKVVPALAQTALEHPWRLAAPAAVLYTVNAAMYAFAAGADEDDWMEIIKRYMTDADFREQARQMEAEERINLPPWMKGATAIGTPKTIRLGTDEATDLPVFLDVARIFPGGDLFDAHNNAGGVPLLAPITPNHPVLTSAAALLFNKDTFRGTEIVKASDTDAEAAAKRAKWAYQQVAPAIAVGNGHFDRAMNVLANATGEPIDLFFTEYTGVDRGGMPVQGKYAAMQTVGIKARPIDLETSAAINEAQQNKLIREIDAEIRSARRLERKGAMTAEQADTIIERQKEKRQRLKEGLTVEGEERE